MCIKIAMSLVPLGHADDDEKKKKKEIAGRHRN